jgi:hypothetical protein
MISTDRDKVLAFALERAAATNEIWIIGKEDDKWYADYYSDTSHMTFEFTSVRFVLPRGEVTKLS